MVFSAKGFPGLLDLLGPLGSLSLLGSLRSRGFLRRQRMAL